MKRRRHSPEEIIVKLREADALPRPAQPLAPGGGSHDDRVTLCLNNCARRTAGGFRPGLRVELPVRSPP